MEVTLTIVDPKNPAATDTLDVVPMGETDDGRVVVGVRLVYDEDDVAVAVNKAVSEARPLDGTIARLDVVDGIDVGPPVVGVSEIAEKKGCRRQYASQLAQRRDFPLPAAELRSTPVWTAYDIAFWLREQSGDKAGRATK